MSGYEHEHEHGHFQPHTHRHRHQGDRPTAAHERSGMGSHNHQHVGEADSEPRPVLPPLTPIPGLDVKRPDDLLSPEAKAALDSNLRDIARTQRMAQASAATMPLGGRSDSEPVPDEGLRAALEYLTWERNQTLLDDDAWDVIRQAAGLGTTASPAQIRAALAKGNDHD